MNSRFVGQRSWARPSRSATNAALADENDRLKATLAAACAAIETAEERERVRIADDLHDILGHALEVVAFKAELADRVLCADVSRARSEMIEVQRVARSAMNDVRSLARCRRPTDLEAELAATVSLFESAGVTVCVTGASGSVRKQARDPLARVLREAVTNVLRHANPTRCLITVTQDPTVASVAIVNDGVEADATTLSSGGTGLAGLSRLLAEHGGRLSAGHSGSGYFTVRASVATPIATPDESAGRRHPHLNRTGSLRLAGQR